MNDKNTNNLFKPIKICRVCSDVALGFNFNGLSCESCKAFFRRNVFKEKDFQCKNENNCLVEKSTRKLCKRCRMNKCFAIGMKRELITIFKEKSMLKQIPENINDLQSYDLKRIHEIELAMRNFPNEHNLPIVGHAVDLMHIIKLTEQYARRAIKFCKSIESFRSLKSDDQIQLLKSFYPEMCIIQTSFIYIEEKDGIRMINETGRETIFGKFRFSENLLSKENFEETIRKLAFPLRVLLGNDTTIRNLMFSQLLFKPRDNTDCAEFVKYNYWLYSHLLRKYLRFKFKHTGDRKFNTIMALQRQITDGSKWCVNFYENEADPNKLPEILREIYNLKI